jgi:ATP-dependent DNA ligase
VVAVDGDNIDFYALGRRMITKRSTRTITFAAFDVLWLDGIDCTQLVYSQRRHALEMLDLVGAAWCTVPRFAFEDADALLAACGRLGQEGVVLKRMDAVYVPGVRTGSWRKIKTAAWRSDHAPRRLPTAIRERIAATELAAAAPPKDPGA